MTLFLSVPDEAMFLDDGGWCANHNKKISQCSDSVLTLAIFASNRCRVLFEALMKISSLPRKVARGLPYLGKELRSIVSDRTPFFVAVPRVVHIWRGAPCNAKCIMCEFGFYKGEALRKLSASAFTDDMMLRVLPQIHELCGRGTLVSYMGGEPTLSKGVVEWVRLASSLGLDFRFTTNGYKLSEGMAAQLVDAGIFNIGVSLESMDAKINEAMRPYTNGTEKTIQAIELLIQERVRQKKYVSINVKTVLTDLNLESFLEIVRRWGKVDGVMCTPQMFEPHDGMPTETKELLYVKDIQRLERTVAEIRRLKAEGYAIHASEHGLDEMLKLYREDKGKGSTMHGQKTEMDPDEPPCNIGTDNLWIHDGFVKLCPYHPPVGNVVTDTATLKEMWQGEMMRRLREQTRACRRLCTISCLRRTPLLHKVNTFLKIA
jgi:MoaA/NifB/PqqE/SkfB family radical SAM enzyme